MSEPVNESLKEGFARIILYRSLLEKVLCVLCMGNALPVTQTDWRQKLRKPETLSPASSHPREVNVKGFLWKDPGIPAHAVHLNIHLQTLAMSFSFSCLIKPAEIMGKRSSSWLAGTFASSKTASSNYLLLSLGSVYFFARNSLPTDAPAHPHASLFACIFRGL